MLLTKKVVVIYGAGGATGSTVARTFAREGARVFVTGRRLAPVGALAADIAAAGGMAEAAQVDALDDWRLAPAWLAGREVLAVFRRDGDPRVAYFIEIAFDDGEVASIRDYRYAAYVARDAAVALEGS